MISARSSILTIREALPFMLQRLDVMPVAMTQLDRPISAYLRENVHYTFSGFNFTPTSGHRPNYVLNGPPLRFDGGRMRIFRQTSREQR
jgi:hypothetical protein